MMTFVTGLLRLARTLGRGHIMLPPVFREYVKNSDAQRHQILGTCTEVKNTHCVQVLTS